MLSFLGKEIVEQAAKKTGFLIRSSKLLPQAFLIAVSFGMFGNGNKTRTGIATTLLVWFGIKISAQAISDRLGRNETVAFFKKIMLITLSRQLELACKNKFSDLFPGLSAVKLEDSTKFELNEKVGKKFKGNGGGASKSAMKMNYCHDITNHSTTHIDIVSGTVPDQKLASRVVKTLKKGELLIRDLGYFSLDAILTIKKNLAYFLSRLSKQTFIYRTKEDENPINVNDFLEEELKNHDYIDCEVYLGKIHRIPVRLIAEKVPDDVKNQRAKRYKKERKREPTEDYVIWSGFSVFITNIPKEIHSAKIIVNVYKIRWQIELFFKSIKSTLSIHVLKGQTSNRVLSLIYAKLISVLLATPIISYAANISEEDEEVSVDKVIKWLHEDNRFGVAVAQGTLEQLLEFMILDFHALCKDKRRKKKSTYQSLKDTMEQEYLNAAENALMAAIDEEYLQVA